MIEIIFQEIYEATPSLHSLMFQKIENMCFDTDIFQLRQSHICRPEIYFE